MAGNSQYTWFTLLRAVGRRDSTTSAGFWGLTLLWLPTVWLADFLVSAVAWMDGAQRPDAQLYLLLSSVVALLILAPMGMPSVLLCRELWRAGYHRMSGSAGAVVLAVTAAIIFSDRELLYTLQWTIGSIALAPALLAPVLPVWIVVYPAVFGTLVWVTAATLQRRRKASAPAQGQEVTGGGGFWLLALLWLPALVMGAILIQWFPFLGASPSELELNVLHPSLTTVPMGEVQLWVRLVPMFLVAPFVFSSAGLAVALPCRQLWRLGYRRAAWTTGAAAALTNAALLAPAMELFLPVTAPEFVGTIGRIVESLYYLAQLLPTDIPVYLAAINLPLLAAVLLLGRRDRTRRR